MYRCWRWGRGVQGCARAAASHFVAFFCGLCAAAHDYMADYILNAV